jgi:tRNA threonylcarbamoyl adenosine modification protein (Sua5/YciO/YrdC/YwlC family)
MTPRHDPVRMVGTMARFIDIHPDTPQQRAVDQAVAVLRDGGLVAYPTDSGYALGAQLGNGDALERIRSIRRLDDKHHFTLVCRDFAQLGQFVHIDNAVFRAVKSATPGPYTFIMPATPEVPRRLLHPKKKTVGARIPDHAVVQALLASLEEPLLSSTLILPGEFEAMTEGWAVQEALDGLVDAVVESGVVASEPTTVIDFVDGVPEVVRVGAGDTSRFV